MITAVSEIDGLVRRLTRLVPPPERPQFIVVTQDEMEELRRLVPAVAASGTNPIFEGLPVVVEGTVEYARIMAWAATRELLRLALHPVRGCSRFEWEIRRS